MDQFELLWYLDAKRFQACARSRCLQHAGEESQLPVRCRRMDLIPNYCVGRLHAWQKESPVE
jgi:hypothetical protein